MNRLRQQANQFDTIPFAAEVLETRTLLSAAGAAHAALHHAAHTPDVTPRAFHQTGTAEVELNGSIIPMLGKISVSHVTFAQGRRTDRASQILAEDSGETITVKGTFKGIVSDVQTANGTTTLKMSANGGSLTFSAKTPSDHSKGIAFPSNKILLATFNNGTFVSIGGTDIFSAKSDPQLAGKPLTVETSP